MLKKLFNIIKKNVKEDKKENKNIELNIITESDNSYEDKILNDKIVVESENEETKLNEVKEIKENYSNLDLEIKEEKSDTIYDKVNKENIEISEEDEEYIKDIKIKRGKSIRAIDIYSEEVKEFKTHLECSKKLKIPVDYIKENLKYGYTDYLGQAISYLREELKVDTEEGSYLESNKTPMELFNILNNKIFTTKIPEYKREEILCSDKIEPIKMHYKFECIDEEYNEYFKKYKSIIRRGGKKRVELIDKKGEVIERFKSLDDCAKYLNKEKSEVVDMLKYFDTKVGRYEIRYSLRGL